MTVHRVSTTIRLSDIDCFSMRATCGLCGAYVVQEYSSRFEAKEAATLAREFFATVDCPQLMLDY